MAHESLAKIEVRISDLTVDPNVNSRKVVNPDADRTLMLSLITHGVLQDPIVKQVYQLDAEGNPELDDDGEPIVLSYLVVAGNRRVLAMRAANALADKHNEMVSSEGGLKLTDEEAKVYPFRNDDNKPILDELVEVEFDVVSVNVLPDDMPIEEANIVENLHRLEMNAADRAESVYSMYKRIGNQEAVAQQLTISQGLVSQDIALIERCIPEGLAALRADQINRKQAYQLTRMLNESGTPDRRAQMAALRTMTEGRDPGQAKPKTQRSSAEVGALRHKLADEAALLDMDLDRRAAVRAAFTWFFCGCDDNALLYGSEDAAFNHEAGLVAPKEKKEKVEKAPKAKKEKKEKVVKEKGKPGPKPGTKPKPRKKTDEAVGETAETAEVVEEQVADEAAETPAVPAAPKPLRKPLKKS